MAEPTTITIEPPAGGSKRERKTPLALVVAWSASDPTRVGEVAVLRPGLAHVLGRGLEDFSASAQPMLFSPRRVPGESARAVTGPGISRRQLEVTSQGDSLEVVNVGRCPMVVDGATVERATLEPGHVVTLHRQLVLLCIRFFERPAEEAAHPFGEPDRFGFVGESHAAWMLRDRLAFVAQSREHVLLLGPTGSGKELAAHAVHGLSPRADGPWMSRNAATLPPGIIDAELFGNLKDYPNPGTPARDGLFGAADGGTLFLDEIGELSQPMQAHLLRVLDSGGEYQRLGEDETRRVDVRLVAATNRPVNELKEDVLARFAIRLIMPPLADRREDIPLIARHLVARAAAETPALRRRFFDDSFPRFAPELIARLLRHDYPRQIRELNALLWRALTESKGEAITLDGDAIAAPSTSPPPDTWSASTLKARLEAHDGNITRTASSLGISRHALRRLLKKLNLDG